MPAPPAAIVTTSFFYGQTMIPQIDETTVANNLNAMLTKLEPQFLEELFGYPLYKQWLLWDGVEAGRFKDLRDGAEYVGKYERTYKWKGLKRSATTSPIANYIYYWWLRKEVSITTGGGEKKSDKASSTNFDSVDKQVRAWNEMVEWNKEFWDYMHVKRDVYPEYFTNNFRPSGNLFTVINPLNL